MIRLDAIGRAACGLALLLGLAAQSFAGSFSVSPVRVTLSAQQPVTAIKVRNNSGEPTVVQLKAMSWAQDGGADILEPTTEILATPPIFTLQPGAEQTVRVGLRRQPDSSRELTYRLSLQEVPSATPKGFQGLRVALQLSIPIFVNPRTPVSPQLAWQASRKGDGQIELRVTNTGTAHVQIGKFELAHADTDAKILSHTAAQYVLPNDTRVWTLKPGSALPSAQSTLLVRATTDAGDMQARVVLPAQ